YRRIIENGRRDRSCGGSVPHVGATGFSAAYQGIVRCGAQSDSRDRRGAIGVRLSDTEQKGSACERETATAKQCWFLQSGLAKDEVLVPGQFLDMEFIGGWCRPPV